METRAEVRPSIQIAVLEEVTNLATQDFAPVKDDGAPLFFLIKNDGPAQVELEVKMMKGTAWIATKFDPGWNPELVQAVRTNVSADINLKYGY